jgi:hypothetical protein
MNASIFRFDFRHGSHVRDEGMTPARHIAGVTKATLAEAATPAYVGAPR